MVHIEKLLYPHLIDISQHSSINLNISSEPWEIYVKQIKLKMCLAESAFLWERRGEAREDKERDWPHNLEGPLGNEYMVLTANLRKNVNYSPYIWNFYERFEAVSKPSTSRAPSKMFSLRENQL